MTDQTTVTINNINYDVSNMSTSDIDILSSMADLTFNTGSAQLDSDQLDAAFYYFVQSCFRNPQQRSHKMLGFTALSETPLAQSATTIFANAFLPGTLAQFSTGDLVIDQNRPSTEQKMLRPKINQ